MVRRPAKSSFGQGQVHGGGRGRGKRDVGVPDSYDAVPRRQVVRISGHVEVDIARLQQAAEAAIAAGMPVTWEVPAAVKVPVAREIAEAVKALVAREPPVAAE
ncbi:hypothetical protein U1Q18_023235, partial [Sarracenia purpurea var. burkii]